jgi:hypothetical protein
MFISDEQLEKLAMNNSAVCQLSNLEFSAIEKFYIMLIVTSTLDEIFPLLVEGASDTDLKYIPPLNLKLKTSLERIEKCLKEKS